MADATLCSVLCGIHALASSAHVHPPVASCTLWHLQGTILNHFDLQTIGIRVNCGTEFYHLKKCITVLAPLAGPGRKTFLIKRVQQTKWELSMGVWSPAESLDLGVHLPHQSASTNEKWQDFEMIKQNNSLNK